MRIRPARDADAPAITAIYNHAVEHTTAIWNDVVVDEENRLTWMHAKRDAGLPLLVAEEGGTAVGYATWGRFRAFDGYRHTIEHSVYVQPDHHGRGIGGALLDALIEEARSRDVHVIVAAIEAGNEPSIRLHRSRGFVETGRMPEVGTKFGRWLDLALLQLTLSTPRDER